MKFDTYLFTSKGGRSYNEDRAEVKIKKNSGLFVLADGLGGHRYGEKAAECVVTQMCLDWEEDKGRNISRTDQLFMSIKHVNEKILSMQEEMHEKMKSTVIAAAVDQDVFSWAGAGDSRLYFVSDGQIFLISQDHSVTYKKYQSGEISESRIPFDEDRSSLLRVVGDEKRCIPEGWEMEEALADGDSFLLCSDGFWEYLSKEEIMIDRLKAETAQEWVELMALRIMEKFQPDTDNMTALAVIVRGNADEMD